MARVGVDEQTTLTVRRTVFGLQKWSYLSSVRRVQSRFEARRVGQFIDGVQWIYTMDINNNSKPVLN